MESDGKYSGLLTGPDPTLEEEKKTEAQLNDERQTSVMQHTPSSYDDEDDDAPAIEQRVEHTGVMVGESHPGTKPKLQASSAFVAEMHKREAAEKAAREKKRQEEEAKAAEDAAKREKELEKKLAEAQELDDETIREEFKRQSYEENKEKLYPDARPITSEVENKLWERRTEEGEQIARRAKLGATYDSELNTSIIIAISLGVVGLVSTIIGVITARSLVWLERVFLIIGLISFIVAITQLTIKAKSLKHHEVPSDQQLQFIYATMIPGVVFRVPFITAATIIPIAGPYVGPFVGCAIAASLHYMYLNNFDVEVSIRETLASTGLYLVIYGVSALGSIGTSNSPTSLLHVAFMIIGYLLGDLLAMRMALKSKK